MILLALAILPALFCDQGPETAEPLRKHGVTRVHVPSGQVEAWRKAGFDAVAAGEAEWKNRIRLTAPRLDRKINVASATRAPWLHANGWRFLRRPQGAWYYDLPQGTAALAAAEAFAYGADAILKIHPSDTDAAAAMLGFLRKLEPVEPRTLADVAVVDDNSAVAGEVMNLLARRNLLYQASARPDPSYAINVRIGSKEFPRSPNTILVGPAKVRAMVTDEKRLLRIYGSEVVIGRLTEGSGRIRLHLLNYGTGKLDGLRIRLRGEYRRAELKTSDAGGEVEEMDTRDGFTEFSISSMRAYAVVDLWR